MVVLEVVVAFQVLQPRKEGPDWRMYGSHAVLPVLWRKMGVEPKKLSQNWSFFTGESIVMSTLD